MKYLLSAATVLLALIVYNVAVADAHKSTSSEIVDPVTHPVEVTMDASAYTGQLDAQTLRMDPHFFLDSAGTKEVAYTPETAANPGSQMTYTLQVPEDTDTLYVVSPVLFLTEPVEEQSLPAQAGAACDAFTVQAVELSQEEANALEVSIDPASTALPVGLVLEVDGYRYTGQQSNRVEWLAGGRDVTLKEWTATFPLDKTDITPEQALAGGILHWNAVGRFVEATEVTYQCEGLTLNPISQPAA